MCIEGDSKDWSQLSHVERQSAEWLGYNEMRWSVRLNQAFFTIFSSRSNFWQNDGGNPFVPQLSFGRSQQGTDLLGMYNMGLLVVTAGIFVYVGYVVISNNIRADHGPIKKSQREALKAFIMKKEAEVLSGSELHDYDLLNEGATDCLHGLFTLYEKILKFEGKSSEAASSSARDSWGGVGAAGWRIALAPGNLNGEERDIAQMLFNAADLDETHRVSCTEFVTLAVLLSATDAHDADAQVHQSGSAVCPAP